MKEINTYIDLYIEFPAKVIEIENVEIIECLNEHGICKASLYIISENEFNFINKITAETDIKIVIKTKEKTDVIFAGIMTNLTAQKIEYAYKIDIELKSKTFFLDCKRKSRSFQNKDNKYTDLFTKIIDEDNNGNSFDNASNGRLQEEAFIQYKETDWEFCKRLASKLNSGIIVNIKSTIPSVCIGNQDGNFYEQITHDFEVIKENEEFLKARFNYGDWYEEEKIFFKIKSVHCYEISDNIKYQNIMFKVFKKKTELFNGFIVYTYWLVKEDGLRENLKINKNISGVSIKGKVIAVTADRVKLHLDIDKEQNIEDTYWYKCQTAYSADGCTGFYSMPQVGDYAELYIPDEYSEGYVKTIIRTDGKNNCKIQNPDIKYYGNTQRKEIMLAPSEIQVTAVNGLILLNMDNTNGIEITSSGDLNIKTQSVSSINSGKISLRAGNNIKLATTKSCIILNSEIHIKSEGGVSK